MTPAGGWGGRGRALRLLPATMTATTAVAAVASVGSGSGGCHGKEKMPHGSCCRRARARGNLHAAVSGSGFVRRCSFLPSTLLPSSFLLTSSSSSSSSSSAFHDWVASLPRSLVLFPPFFLPQASSNDAATPMVKVKVGDDYGNWCTVWFFSKGDRRVPSLPFKLLARH